MKYKDYVHSGASRTEALDAFDGLVQRIVSHVMQVSVSSPLSYKYIVVFSCLTEFSKTLDCISALIRQYGIFDVNVLVASMIYISASFSFFPLGGILINWMTSRCLFLCGWREWAWIVSIVFLSCV